MSHETTLRSLYTALNDKDTSAIKDLLTEDATFHMLPNPVLAPTTLTGRDTILAWMDENIGALDMQQDIDEVSVNGDFATVYVTSQSKGADGNPLPVRWADLFRFDGDRVAGHVSLSA